MTIQEQSTVISGKLSGKPVTSAMEVFYNPVMKSNRNISVLLLKAIENKEMNLAFPVAGSGIRPLRFLNELSKQKINAMFVNDLKDNFVRTFTENLKLNKIKKTKSINIDNRDANLFLIDKINMKTSEKPAGFCGYFDYIDIDPFGSPNPFLSSAIARISRKGILAVTATDTAALTGTYAATVKRKYWSANVKNYLMHETGLRILIRKVQLLGIQFDKALTPILAYHKDHYFRIYFRSENGKKKCDAIVKQHQYLLYCSNCLNFKTSVYNQEKCNCKKQFNFIGSLWIGELINKETINEIVKINTFPEEQSFLNILQKESKYSGVGFYDVHVIAKKLKIPAPRMDTVLQKLKGVRTSFSVYGIKTNKSIKEVKKVIKQQSV